MFTVFIILSVVSLTSLFIYIATSRKKAILFFAVSSTLLTGVMIKIANTPVQIPQPPEIAIQKIDKNKKINLITEEMQKKAYEEHKIKSQEIAERYKQQTAKNEEIIKKQHIQIQKNNTQTYIPPQQNNNIQENTQKEQQKPQTILPQPTPDITTENTQQKYYTVTEVVDGDTFKIDYNGVPETVRLLLVDTPESKHPKKYKNVPMGEVATEYTKNFLKNNKVRLEFDKEQRDKYNRLLAYVYIQNGQCLNEELIRNGMAKVVKYEPNVSKYDEYKEIERQVRPSGIGIWADIAGNYPQTKPPKQSQPQEQPQTQKEAPASTEKLIKGNINSKGEKIYHVPGGAFYEKTDIDESKGERWFSTEEEAQAAGFRRAIK
ncbi:MAG: thermonuclease family protein [Peptostreptococcaceae bacterium]|nr:thermonuclease family protein [Peptostreptococcaceae bacterium]